MHTKHFILTKQRRGHPVNTSPKMSNMFERNFLENWNVDTSMNTNKNPFSATQFREGCLQNRYCEFDHFWDYLILPWLFNCKLYLPVPACLLYALTVWKKIENHNCAKMNFCLGECLLQFWKVFHFSVSPIFQYFECIFMLYFYSLCYKLTSMLSGVGAGAKKGEREAISM